MYYLRFHERKGNRTGLVRALSLNRKIWSLLRLSSAINGIQSTPALRTPRYYEHPAITDSSKIPGESYRRLTEINSHYYGLSLLRTYGHFIPSQRHNFIVFSLGYSGHRAASWNIYTHIKSIFSAFCLFWSIFTSSVRQSKFLNLFLLMSSLQSRCHK